MENQKPYVACPSCGAGVTRDALYRAGDEFICIVCEPEIIRMWLEALEEEKIEELRLKAEEARQSKIEADENFKRAKDNAINLRKDYIRHEASLRTAGSLYYVKSGFATLMALGIVFWAERVQPENELTVVAKVIIGVLLALALVGIWIGRLFRRLDPAVIKPAKFCSTIGLLAFPHGTIIYGYILHLLRSSKNQAVLSDSYRRLIKKTPEIKCRISPLAWIVAVLVILTVVCIVALKLTSPAPGN